MRHHTFFDTIWRAAAAVILAGGLLLGDLTPGQAASTNVPDPVPEVVYTYPDDSYPTALLVDTQANLWVSLGSGNALSRVSGPSGSLTQTRYDLPTPAGLPYDLALGQDRAVWFTEQTANQLGRYTAADDTLQELARDPADGDPSQVIQNQDGRLWFTEFNHNRLGWIDPDGQSGLVELPHANSRPLGLAVDLDGNVWFTEWNAARLGKIDPQGQLSEIDLPATPTHPAEIILGPDGALWFTYESAAVIGRLDPTVGDPILYTLPAEAGVLSDLTIGADGNIWFVGFTSLGYFEVTANGPDRFHTRALSSLFESRGRSQIVQGPDEEIYYIRGNSQSLSAVDVDLVGLRDLQLYVDEYPPLVLTAGAYAVQLSVVNASVARADELVLHIDLPAGTHLQTADPSAGDCQDGAAGIDCTLDSLLNSQEWTVRLTLVTDRVDNPGVQGEFTAQVSAHQHDYLPANNIVRRKLNAANTHTYSADFDAGVDEHWSDDSCIELDGSNPALGPFSNQTVRLSFSGLPAHDETLLCFDLYVLGAWDGSQPGSPDQWTYAIDGQPILSTTFSNRDGYNQAYPGSYPDLSRPAHSGGARVGDYNGDGRPDARYSRCATLAHSGSSLEFSFWGSGLDAAEPEQWALDNVRVQTNFHDALYHVLLLLMWGN